MYFKLKKVIVMTTLNRFLFIIVFSFLVFVVSREAIADCSNPTGTEGQMTYNTTHKTAQFCDGTTWWSMKGAPASGDLASKDYVDAAVAAGGGGACYYSRYSNTCGAGFTQMPGQLFHSNQTQYVCCSSTLTSPGVSSGPPSFFVLTSGSWTGNLGGLAGANAKCLVDLQAFNWLGKDQASLSSTTVKAFLCDSTTCNPPLSKETYYFARSGSTNSGGDSFTTDIYARGPLNAENWAVSSKFGSSTYTYWSNRGGSGIGNEIWGISPSNTNSCNNWTSPSSGYGNIATSSSTDDYRWVYTTAGCHNSHKLICMVHGE